MNDQNQEGVDLPAFSGGCQCGAVRYDVAAGPGFASICHCRMCQRATGGAFLASLGVATARITWRGAPPAVFASSNIAERGFCAACGTPLFYRAIGDDETALTLGSLPEGLPFQPAIQWGTEARRHWLDGLAIPGCDTTETGVVSRQSPEDAA